MDRRIRDLERRGVNDPEAMARAMQLRCMSQGHLTFKIESVAAWEDFERQCWIIQVQMDEDRNLNIPIGLRPSLTQDYVEKTIAGHIQQHIAKCPRCGEPNDLAIGYTRGIIDGLKRLEDERLRHEPGPSPFRRESLLRRGNTGGGEGEVDGRDEG